MESNPSNLSTPGSSSHRFAAPARLALSIAVLAALYRFGYLDLKALTPLGHAPWTIAAVSGLTLVTLPIATWRWAIVLRALSIKVPLSPLFRTVCISTFVGQVSFGPLSADAVRGIYVWRVLRQAPGRIVISVLVDRALGLISLLAVTALMMMLRWERVRDVPELRLLALSLLVSLAGTIVVSAILLGVPSLAPFNVRGLQRFRQLKRRLAQIRDVLLAFRKSPLVMVAALCLSFMI